MQDKLAMLAAARSMEFIIKNKTIVGLDRVFWKVLISPQQGVTLLETWNA